MNLCMNARHAIDGSGKITIKSANRRIIGGFTHDDLLPDHPPPDHLPNGQLRPDNPDARAGEFVELTVSDNGCGMNEVTRGRIFEPFFTTKGIGVGTGLGLAMVYGIASSHNGWVEVASTEGEGSVFRVYLPRSLKEPAPGTALATTPSTPPGTPPMHTKKDADQFGPSDPNRLTGATPAAVLASQPRQMTRVLQDDPALATHRETVRRAIGRLRDLPCSLPVVQKAIAAIEDPNCTNGRLEHILTADQGISARLLRLANSAYFGVSRNVSTLSMAVALIGYGRLQTILRHIMVAEVFEMLSAKSPTANRIWKVAIAAGAASRATAQAGWVGDPEELLTVGLLHSAGDLALLCQFPEEYLVAEAGESGSVPESGPLHSVFGVDSGTAGQWLLDGWLFPSIFGTSCRYWPDPFSTGVEECYRPRLAAVHIGVELARSWVEGIDLELATQGLLPEAVGVLDLDGDAISEIYGSLEQNVNEVLELLDLV